MAHPSGLDLDTELCLRPSRQKNNFSESEDTLISL
jgi:hypothetical protein